jgi:hypothetical protein
VAILTVDVSVYYVRSTVFRRTHFIVGLLYLKDHQIGIAGSGASRPQQRHRQEHTTTTKKKKKNNNNNNYRANVKNQGDA